MTRPYITVIALLIAGTVRISAQDYMLSPVPDFNSPEADFSAQYYRDGIIFCSTRSKTALSFVDDSSLSLYYTDLFLARLKENGTYTSPELFSSELTTLFNEGPLTFSDDESTIYYTGNIEPKDATKKVKLKEYKLGIFIAVNINGKWEKQAPFPFNTPDGKFDVAHPALAPGDSVLYFASNMPGGQGGTDIYRCHWRMGRWSVPVNLGATINTRGNEFYPFVAENGTLYFSTDGISEEMGLDIYMAKPGAVGFRTPKALPFPINTPFDDFAYVARSGGHEGYFSSNRNLDFDDIYHFTKPTPDFSNCHENEKARFCYEIEDINLHPIDTLPLVYEWDLGDGNKARGLKVKHCYKEMGRYEVKLNVIDTTTKFTFFNVSNAIVDIQSHDDHPFITSLDSVYVNTPITLSSTESELKNVDEYYWVTDDGEQHVGLDYAHTFTIPGIHTITLGSLGDSDDRGLQTKTCAQKMIVVLPDSTLWDQASYELRMQSGYTPLRMKSNFTIETYSSGAELKPYYRLVIKESDDRVPFNDPFFSKVQYEIVESRTESGGYEYAVATTTDVAWLYPKYKELQEAGYKDVHIASSDLQQFSKSIVRTGEYIPPGSADKLNIEFMKLSDIKFEYNSAEIKPESFGNLNYIVSMLKLESDFEVKIHAHTCNKGKADYNMKLSDRRAKSVFDYIASKGIDTKRMHSQGFGITKPMADNDTEEGRIQNRRVEFIIVFPQKNE